MGMQDYGPGTNPLSNPSHTAHHKAIADAIIIDGPLDGRFSPLGHTHDSTRGFRYLWAGTSAAVDPGAGGIAVENTGGQNRTLAISDTDAGGTPRNLGILLPGDNLVVTDDPATPPVTGFARYMLTGDVVAMAGYVTVTAVRTDTAGSTATPANGTSIRVIVSYSGGAPA